MVALDITETSKALACAGGYVCTFGLVSYFVKERMFMSEALVATVTGIILGPLTLKWFTPVTWSSDFEYLTFQIARVVIAIQVLFTGISLPKAYLWREKMSLFTLLLPIMTIAWFICGLLIWGLIPGLTFLEALVIGSCVTPTDPVLANSICKGRFAEKHVPLHVREIILAESGANDGLGFPFLYIGLYLILIKTPGHRYHSDGGAILEWFYNIVLYDILLSCIIGAVFGYLARKILYFAEDRRLIDHESFLSFGVGLTFLLLGVVGILGSDDILACFIAGNSMTWDDKYRIHTEDHAFQDVIDQLLNTGAFLYIGAILPWSGFGDHFSPWRLVVLGILVMLVRRLPWVLALRKMIPALPSFREAAFAGFFGPIGVGAIYYTQVALQEIPDDGSRDRLRTVIAPVVYFLVLTSIIVHGITIPIGKGSFHMAKTKSLGFGNRSRSNSATLTARKSKANDQLPAEPRPLMLGSEAQRREVEQALADKRKGERGQAVKFDDGAGRREGTPEADGRGSGSRDQSVPPSPATSTGSAVLVERDLRTENALDTPPKD